MRRQELDVATNNDDHNLALIGKIYDSFEALEQTLGMLKLEEPLFITYAAKKSFAQIIFKNIEKNSSGKKQFKN